MDGSGSFGGSAGADFSIKRTQDAAAVPNHQAIDDPDYLKPQKVWLFSGYNDGTVRRAAMDAVAKYYENYVNVGNDSTKLKIMLRTHLSPATME